MLTLKRPRPLGRAAEASGGEYRRIGQLLRQAHCEGARCYERRETWAMWVGGWGLMNEPGVAVLGGKGAGTCGKGTARKQVLLTEYKENFRT